MVPTSLATGSDGTQKTEILKASGNTWDQEWWNTISRRDLAPVAIRAVQGGSGSRDPANEIFVAPKNAAVPLIHPREGGLITSLLHYGKRGYQNTIFNSIVNTGLLHD